MHWEQQELGNLPRKQCWICSRSTEQVQKQMLAVLRQAKQQRTLRLAQE